MKNKMIAGAFIMALFSLAACSSITVTTDYDKTVDFSKYKTFEYYGWTDESDKILNRFDKERIESAFGEELKKRNLKYVKEDGQLVVSLYIVVDQKTSTTAYTNHYGMGPYGGYGYGYGAGWGWGGGSSTTTYSDHDYLVGTLVLDVFDKKTKGLVWQGVGQKTVNENPDKREKNVEKLAAAILKDFPIKIVE